MKKIHSINIINNLLFGCALVGFTHSAFSQQQDSGFELVEIRGAVKLTDITSFVPNVNLSPHGPTGGANAFPSISIRGMGQSDFNIVTDPGVGIYVDGIFVSRGIGELLDVVEIERVEVLRGSINVPLADNIFVYITYTEGFRDGGFPGRSLGSPTAASFYDPEFVTSITIDNLADVSLYGA